MGTPMGRIQIRQYLVPTRTEGPSVYQEETLPRIATAIERPTFTLPKGRYVWVYVMKARCNSCPDEQVQPSMHDNYKRRDINNLNR